MLGSYRNLASLLARGGGYGRGMCPLPPKAKIFSFMYFKLTVCAPKMFYFISSIHNNYNNIIHLKLLENII